MEDIKKGLTWYIKFVVAAVFLSYLVVFVFSALSMPLVGTTISAVINPNIELFILFGLFFSAPYVWKNLK
ncbi:hypothetical protein [Shewanella sp. 30m-9]